MKSRLYGAALPILSGLCPERWAEFWSEDHPIKGSLGVNTWARQYGGLTKQVDQECRTRTVVTFPGRKNFAGPIYQFGDGDQNDLLVRQNRCVSHYTQPGSSKDHCCVV